MEDGKGVTHLDDKQEFKGLIQLNLQAEVKKSNSGTEDKGPQKKKIKAERYKRIDPTKPHCAYWLEDKKRFCRLNPLRDTKFCGEHVNKMGYEPQVMDNGRVRIPCPYENNHTCFEDQLQKHLKKCNYRPQDVPFYIQSDINVYCDLSESHRTRGMGINDVLLPMNAGKDYECSYIDELTDEQYSSVIRDIISLHQRDIQMDERYGCHPIIGRELVRSDIGYDAARHLAQIGSIMNILEEEGLFKDGTCFIEYGSGRGTLSYNIALAILEKGLKNCSFLLVDLTSPRHKQDNRLKDSGLTIRRVRADIKDIVVADLPGVQSDDTLHIVGVAKHICGNAADMALFSLFKPDNEVLGKVSGAVIATCCHHRCDKNTYIGKNFVQRKFPSSNFHLLTQMGAWGTDGDAESTIDKNRVINEDHRRFYEQLLKFVPHLYLRKTIGHFVKEVIDFGRAQFIEADDKNMFFAETVKFVDTLTTPENTAIVVSKRQNHHEQRRARTNLQIKERNDRFKEALRSVPIPVTMNAVF